MPIQKDGNNLNLRIVVLDNPLETWDSPLTQDLFKQIIQLKLSGYRSEYPQNVLPFDGSDFYGTHLMICKEEPGQRLTPLVGYKAVSLARCEARRQVFPPVSILRASGAEDRTVLEIVGRCRDQRTQISYDSSWTMLPQVRQDRELSRHLRDLTTTIGVLFHREFKIPEWIVMGIKRFKTDQYFRWMGHSDVTPEFKNFGSFDEPAFLLHLKEYSSESVQVAEQYRALWEDKLLISAQGDEMARLGSAA